MNFNMAKWTESLISNNIRKAMPITTYLGLNFTGKTILDVVTKGEEQAACIIELSKRFPSIASVMVMDLSVEAEAFGSEIEFHKNEVPSVKERLVKDLLKANNLNIPKVGVARTAEYIRAAKIASKKMEDKPLFAGMIGPFSLAGRLLDMSEIMTAIFLQPEEVKIVLEKATTFLKEYALAYKENSVSGIIIAEPAAGLLSKEDCHQYSSLFVKEIIDYVQDDSFGVMLHNCGQTVELVPSMLSTGAMGFHFGNAVDMLDILSQIPKNILTLGNIDPAGIFKMSNDKKVFEVTTKLLNKTRSYSNFIISSGCDVPPGTNVINMEAFYKAIELFNNKTEF